MLKSPLYSNDLTLNYQAKTIPYAASRQAEARGSVNYGFKNLKIKPALIETIPELADDAGLKSLVGAINRRESCFLTVGCSSNLENTTAGHQRKGYLEFAWNCTNCVQDAVNYFALYFHFNKSLLTEGFNQPVDMKWIIQEASFMDVEVHGFSCAVHIETKALSSPEQANQAWHLSLRMIDAYLLTVETLKAHPIYKPLSSCSSEL